MMKTGLLLGLMALVSSSVSFKVVDTCSKEGNWAFTLDEGPHSTFTPSVLDVLKEEQVKATFFVIGRNLKTPEQKQLVKRAFDEGHLIASHSYSHARLSSLKDDEIRDEVKKTDEALISVIGHAPSFFRPPHGEKDERVLSILESMGKTAVFWNVDSEDWKHPGEQEPVLSNYRQAIQDRKSSVISLAHDIHEVTVQSLQRILQEIKGANYNLVRLDECVENVPGYTPTKGKPTPDAKPEIKPRKNSEMDIPKTKPEKDTPRKKTPKEIEDEDTDSFFLNRNPKDFDELFTTFKKEKKPEENEDEFVPFGSEYFDEDEDTFNGEDRKPLPPFDVKIVTRDDGTCGPYNNGEIGKCYPGYCCSKWNYCGSSEAHCGVGCQPLYGKCN